MNQEIPDGWNKVKFKELAKQKSVRIDNPGESGFDKYVGLEHLDSGELVVKRYGSTSDVTSTMKLFNKGDILFARRNTYLRRVSVAPFDGVCSGDIIVLEPILNHIVEGFLPIFMQFEPFENKIIALSAGAFSKRIKWKQLAEEDIDIPSVGEQKKIVEVVWSIEYNADKNKGLMNTTEVLKQGLLNELLTKGIGHTKFKQTEIGKIPFEWDVVPINKLFSVITGTTPSTKQIDYWKPYEVNWYTPLDLGKLGVNKELQKSNKQISKNGLSKTSLKEIPENTILISTRAPVGYVGITTTKAAFNQGCKAIIPHNEQDHLFYSEYLSNFKSRLECFSGGSTFKELTKKSLMEIKIPSLKIEEQKLISSKIQSINSNIISLKKNRVKLHALKQKLTNDYLSGKLLIPKEVL